MNGYNKLLLVIVNILIGLAIFYFIQPVHYIPSDGFTFAKGIEDISKCLEKNEVTFCWPKPNYFYTKPTLTYLGGFVHWILNPYFSLSGISVLALLSVISITLVSVIFQIVISSIARYKFIAVVITGALVYTSPTVLVATFWWGYAALITLFIYVSWMILWDMTMNYIDAVRGSPFLIRKVIFLSVDYTFLIILSTLAFYIHLSSIPFLLSGFLCIIFFVPVLLETCQVNRKRSSYFVILFQPRVVLFSILLITNIFASIVSIEKIDEIAMGNKGYSYLSSYKENLEINKKAEQGGNLSYMLNAMMPVMYYITARWPIFILVIVLVMVVKIENGSVFLKTNERVRLSFILFAAFFGLLVIMFGESTKQIRITFPANMAVVLGVSFLLVSLIDNSILRKKTRAYVILNVIVLVAIMNYLYTSFIMNKSIWLSSFGLEHILDKVEFENQTIINNKKRRLFVEKNIFWDEYLENVALVPKYTKYTYLWLQHRLQGEGENIFIFITPIYPPFTIKESILPFQAMLSYGGTIIDGESKYITTNEWRKYTKHYGENKNIKTIISRKKYSYTYGYLLTRLVGDKGDEKEIANFVFYEDSQAFKKNDYILVRKKQYLNKHKKSDVIYLPFCRRPPVFNFVNEGAMKQYVNNFIEHPIHGMLRLYTICSLNEKEKTKWYIQKI